LYSRKAFFFSFLFFFLKKNNFLTHQFDWQGGKNRDRPFQIKISGALESPKSELVIRIFELITAEIQYLRVGDLVMI
jgi:hypothetical protein